MIVKVKVTFSLRIPWRRMWEWSCSATRSEPRH